MSVIEILDDEHLDLLLEDHEYVLVDFYINSCGPCKQFAPVYEQLSNSYPTICFAKVNAYSQNCREIAEEYNVTKFPTFIILERNNRELLYEPIVGVKPDIIISKLDSLVSYNSDDSEDDF